MKKYFTFRVWLLILFLVLAFFTIAPNPWATGVEVASISPSSEVSAQGLSVGDQIYSINDQEVSTVDDVLLLLESYEYDAQEITIETSEETVTYSVTNDVGFVVDENLTVVSSTVDVSEDSTVLSINGDLVDDFDSFDTILDSLIPEQTYKIQTDSALVAYVSRAVPDFTVTEARTSNLLFGLDFTGGTRVLLQPISEDGVSDDDIEALIDVLSNRLNVYGLSDVKIRSAADWEGNKFVLVEIAGVTESEVKELIGQQGVFEAYIGEDLVFSGGNEDVVYVCRNDGTCSGVRSCNAVSGGHSCQFEFSVTLSEEAAQRQADATKDLLIVTSESGSQVLSENIDFFLDGEQVDSLQIGADLQGQATTTIAISGPGFGVTQDDAILDAQANMNTLQTILITGSLPFDIEIVKVDTVSPVLGETFLANVLWVVIGAILSVAVVLYIRYRSFKVILPVMGAMVSELFLILGFAALVRWNLDMAAMAGILAAIGTGVDDQIVILDETIKGEHGSGNWKEKLKRAFFIIFVAYATTVAAMIPLWNAGAGLIRGFALTTIAGVTIGVLLTRPAFASVVEKLFKE